MNFSYLDYLPKIPENLLVDFYNEAEVTSASPIGKDGTHFVPLPYKIGPFYRFQVKSFLKDWIQENILLRETKIGCQHLEKDIPPHTDGRHWALNYIIDTGRDAQTLFYQKYDGNVGPQWSQRTKDNLSVTESVTFESFRWHILNTHVIHSVDNVVGKRISITVNVRTDDPFLIVRGM